MIQFKMIITFETRVSSVDVRAKESVTLNHASAMQTGSVARSVLSACFYFFTKRQFLVSTAMSHAVTAVGFGNETLTDW